MKKAAFFTLGCRVNQYETQCVREGLLERGFQECSPEEDCDLYFLNTCAVTGEVFEKESSCYAASCAKKRAVRRQ